MSFETDLFEHDHALFIESDYRIIDGEKFRLFLTVYEQYDDNWYGYFSLVPSLENVDKAIKLKLMESNGLEEHELIERDILHEVPELVREFEVFYLCGDNLNELGEEKVLNMINSYDYSELKNVENLSDYDLLGV